MWCAMQGIQSGSLASTLSTLPSSQPFSTVRLVLLPIRAAAFLENDLMYEMKALVVLQAAAQPMHCQA